MESSCQEDPSGKPETPLFRQKKIFNKILLRNSPFLKLQFKLERPSKLIKSQQDEVIRMVIYRRNQSRFSSKKTKINHQLKTNFDRKIGNHFEEANAGKKVE